jgi:hypothetical protein
MDFNPQTTRGQLNSCRRSADEGPAATAELRVLRICENMAAAIRGTAPDEAHLELMRGQLLLQCLDMEDRISAVFQNHNYDLKAQRPTIHTYVKTCRLLLDDFI